MDRPLRFRSERRLQVPPRLLASADRSNGFECRPQEQTICCEKHARQAPCPRRHSRVFRGPPKRASIDRGGLLYAWCLGPASLRRRLRCGFKRAAGSYPSPLPCWLAWRVDLHHARSGPRWPALLADVIGRTAQIGSESWLPGDCRSMREHIGREHSICISSRNRALPTDPCTGAADEDNPCGRWG